jgi:cell division protein FtsB
MDLRRFFVRFAPLVVGFSILGYFIYHGFAGKRGILQYWIIRQQIDDAQFKLLQLREQRTNLENKIQRLHPSSLDLDFLEEQVIKSLNAIPNDALLIINEE